MRIVKRLRLKYGGRCSCGARIRIGEPIGYFREQGRGKVMCSSCFERWAQASSPSQHEGAIYIERKAVVTK